MLIVSKSYWDMMTSSNGNIFRVTGKEFLTEDKNLWNLYNVYELSKQVVI